MQSAANSIFDHYFLCNAYLKTFCRMVMIGDGMTDAEARPPAVSQDIIENNDSSRSFRNCKIEGRF